MKYAIIFLFFLICNSLYSQETYLLPNKQIIMQQHIYLLEQENRSLKKELEECKSNKEEKHLIINGVTSVLSIVATGYCLHKEN